MGDIHTVQKQLEALLKMYKEDKVAAEQLHNTLATKFEELSQQVTNRSHESFSDQDGENCRNDSSDSHHEDNRNNEKGKGFVLKFSKIYDGKSVPLGWLNRCEHFFRHQHTQEGEKVGLASFHFEGEGQLWFSQLEQGKPDLTWEEFKNQCHLRFGPSPDDNHLGDLVKLQQTGTMAAYQHRFSKLLARAAALTRTQQIKIFLSGLQEHIAIDVAIQKPSDLTCAMNLARLYEPRAGVQIPPHCHVTNAQQCTPVVKQLSRTEMEARLSKGLCYNCDEIYTQGHHCKKLFLLEGVEEVVGGIHAEEGEEENMEVSIHAISGTRVAKTTQMLPLKTELEETKAQELSKLQEALHSMQTLVEEANARVIKEREAARKAIEEAPPVIKETPVMVQDMAKIDALTAELESLKALLLSEKQVGEEAKETCADAEGSNMDLAKKLGEAEGKVEQLRDSAQRLEEKLSNLESENQVLRQQALTMSPTGKSKSARPRRMTIVKDMAIVAANSKEPESEEKPQKSLNDKQQENQDLLIKCISQDLGFSGGKPVAACVIYKCLFHWRSFEVERTTVFDRII